MSSGTPAQPNGNLQNLGGPTVGRDASSDPPTTGHKKTSSLGPLALLNANGVKYVKPQELNLDMIVPSSMKAVKASNSTIGGPTSNSNNMTSGASVS